MWRGDHWLCGPTLTSQWPRRPWLFYAPPPQRTMTKPWSECSPDVQASRIETAIAAVQDLKAAKPPKSTVRLAYTDELLRAAIAAHRRGLSWKAIAASLVEAGLPQVSHETICRWAKELHQARPAPAPAPAQTFTEDAAGYRVPIVPIPEMLPVARNGRRSGGAVSLRRG